MVTIEVLRRGTVPEVSLCKGKGCGKHVEWVTVGTSGRRMPVTHPLLPVREHEKPDGRFVTIINADQVHYATCPASDTFRKQRSTKKTRTTPQLRLFER